MATREINNVIEGFDQLDGNDKEFVAEIINKLFSEHRREQIFQRAEEAEKNFNAGKIKSGGIREMMGDLEDD